MQKVDNMPVEAGNIIFYCPTAVLDEMILTAQGKVFDKEMAERMDKRDGSFKFVVDYDLNYSVVPSKMVEKAGFPSGDKTEVIEKVMWHYINSLGFDLKPADQ